MKLLGGFVLVMSLLFAGSAFASGWIAERVTQTPQVSIDGTTWRALAAGQEVPNAAWINTGPDGRVMLRRGAERILLKQGTLAALATWRNRGINTKITQRSGTVLLDVETRSSTHTSVVTPHLAAVVKGTTFEVSSSGAGSTVDVFEGRVQVNSGSEGRSVSVTAGQRARVARGASARVEAMPSRGRPDFAVGGPSGGNGDMKSENGKANGRPSDNGKAGGTGGGTGSSRGSDGRDSRGGSDGRDSGGGGGSDGRGGGGSGGGGSGSGRGN